MTAQKKSGLILITALIMMALVTVGCERSYAPIDESLATPTVGGDAFPEALPSDMEGVFASGAETSTAIALASGVPPVDTATLPAILTASVSTVTSTPEATDSTASTSTSTPPVIATNTALPPASTVGKPASYTLKKGEFPYCIARRFNVDPDELLTLNNLSSAQAQCLQPGLTLSIPQSGATFPSTRALNAHPVSNYSVPQNTTVYGVACHFGDVDPATILNSNSNITNADNIAAGTILSIP